MNIPEGAMSGVSSPVTIHEFLTFLAPEFWAEQVRGETRPPWPPDVFALVASLLQRSGAHPRVVHPPWPPTGHDPTQYLDEIIKLGAEWRTASRSGLPSGVARWWHL